MTMAHSIDAFTRGALCFKASGARQASLTLR
jgi:hypothetical protein